MSGRSKEGFLRTAAAAMPSVATYRISPEVWPAEKELAAFREVLGEAFVRVEFELLPAGGSFSATLHILPELSILSGSCSGAIARRTRALIADGNDNFIFGIAIAGIGVVSRSGREKMLTPGEGILLSCAEEGTLAFPDGARFIGIRVPRHALSNLVPDPEASLFKPVPKNTDSLKLLQGYLSAIEEYRPPLNSVSDLEAGRVVAAHMQNLIALALDTPRGSLELAKSRCVPVVRLHAIKKDIANLLGRAALSVGLIAARHGVSPRYIQQLFEAKGTTFSEFVLGRRLALAHRRLSDPAHAGHTITEIAFEAGFSDLSYFNRSFRRYYGAAPSGLRLSERHGREPHQSS